MGTDVAGCRSFVDSNSIGKVPLAELQVLRGAYADARLSRADAKVGMC